MSSGAKKSHAASGGAAAKGQAAGAAATAAEDTAGNGGVQAFEMAMQASHRGSSSAAPGGASVYCKLVVLVVAVAAAVLFEWRQLKELGDLRHELASKNAEVQNYKEELELRRFRAASAIQAQNNLAQTGRVTAEEQEALDRDAAGAFVDSQAEVKRRLHVNDTDFYMGVLRAESRLEKEHPRAELVEALDRLRSPGLAQRVEAAAALGELGGPAAAQALVEALLDRKEEPHVREAAARACGRLAQNLEGRAARRAVVEGLASAMLTHSIVDIKAAAAYSIGSFGVEGPLPAVALSCLKAVTYDGPNLLFQAASTAVTMIEQAQRKQDQQQQQA